MFGEKLVQGSNQGRRLDLFFWKREMIIHGRKKRGRFTSIACLFTGIVGKDPLLQREVVQMACARFPLVGTN